MGQDVLAEEVLKQKAERRAALRAEYWKQVTNPHRHAAGEGGTIVSFLSSVLHHHTPPSKYFSFKKQNKFRF